MPQVPESSSDQSIQPSNPNPFYQSQARAAASQGNISKGKKKGKNAAGKEDAVTKEQGKTLPPMTHSPPSLHPHTFGGHSPPVIAPSERHVTSPLLDALGSIGASQDNETASRTDAWTRSIPFGKIPNSDIGDGLNISGSPPVASSKLGRGGFAAVSPPSSPPLRMVRPVSQSNVYGNFPDSRDHSRDKSQRHSFGAQHAQYPPLPHLPQAHFYGAPDVEVGSHPRSSWRDNADTGQSFCAFDVLPAGSFGAIRQPTRVILTGGEGKLQVLSIENGRPRVVGRLDGLPGVVLDAKILPWTSRTDPLAEVRPLIAVIIHGIAEQSEPGEPPTEDDPNLSLNDDLPDAPRKPASSRHSQDEEGVRKYQTRVEVYSLLQKLKISTLFASQSVAAVEDFPMPYPVSPQPVGDLKLHAQGNLIVVSSGVSGEVFIYGVEDNSEQSEFQCLGKVWTTPNLEENRRFSSSSIPQDLEDSPVRSPRGTPSMSTHLLSLSNRWLAVVPPSPSFRFSLYGQVPISLRQTKRPGIDSHTSSSRPPTTCVIDTPDPETLFNKVAREVTQEFVKGAKWIGDQGVQAWKYYWNKDSPNTPSYPAQNRTIHHLEPAHQPSFFPPTHANDSQTSSASADPDLVCIYDLCRFEESHEARNALTPVATFQPPNGCSFLSFSPSGLWILTASRKGDVQYIWDLLQMVNCRAGSVIAEEYKSSGSSTASSSPRVRQLARYARLTTSSVVDVVWTSPMGDRLAVLTRKGTVHLFDLPVSAFQWPSFRRLGRPSTAPANQADNSNKESLGEEPTPASNPFAFAMNIVGGRTQPILAAVRGRAPSIGHTFSGAGGLVMGSSTGMKGGKAVAAGLSKSVGAATSTVSNLRHVGENRLHLSGLAKSSSSSHVLWFGLGQDLSIGLIDGTSFKLYRVGRSSILNKDSRQRASIFSTKAAEFKIPPVSESPRSPPMPSVPVLNNRHQASGFLHPASGTTGNPTKKTGSHPLSQAEIETNAPYQPFHTDRRVSLRIYLSDANLGYPEESVDTWVFGDDIFSTKLHVWDPSRDHADESLQEQAGVIGQMENLISLGETGGDGTVEQVVVTTRRRKAHHAGTESSTRLDDDGFFEDDCEVLDFAGDRV